MAHCGPLRAPAISFTLGWETGNPVTRIDYLFSVYLQTRQGAFLIVTHEAAITDHVGGKDGSQSAFHALSPSLRRLATMGGRIHAAQKVVE